MNQQKPNSYSAEFKERAVKLAVESDQPIAQTARDLGVNENTLHTWTTKYHGTRGQQARVNAEHVCDELKRLKKENALLKEERDILKKAAACAAQRPSRQPVAEVRLDESEHRYLYGQRHVSRLVGLAQWLL